MPPAHSTPAPHCVCTYARQLSGWFRPTRRAGSLQSPRRTLFGDVTHPRRLRGRATTVAHGNVTSAPGPSGPGSLDRDAVRRDLAGHGRLEKGGMRGSWPPPRPHPLGPRQAAG